MSINSTIRAAVTPIVAVCVPDVYTGTATEYCTFNYTEYPEEFSDDAPHALKYSVQLHYFCPTGVNPDAKKTALKKALFGADFTYPDVINAVDEDGQHWIFECEYLDGADTDG